MVYENHHDNLYLNVIVTPSIEVGAQQHHTNNVIQNNSRTRNEGNEDMCLFCNVHFYWKR